MRGCVTGFVGQIYKAENVGQYFLLSFSVAESVYMGRDKGKETCWHKCEIWGKIAENVANFLEKGMFVSVYGQAFTQTFIGNDGLEKTSLVVKANDITIGPRNEDKHEASTPHQAPPPSQSNAQKAANVFGDDIPF